MGADGQLYGAAVTSGEADPCEQEVVEQLVDLRRKAAEIANDGGRVTEDEAFFAEQNARLVRNAERYYGAMFRGGPARGTCATSTWPTPSTPSRRLSAATGSQRGSWCGRTTRISVTRATEMGEHGEHNLGQLVRERHPDQVVSVGFTTATGTVTAARDWDGPAKRQRIRPPLPDSIEDVLHQTAVRAFQLALRDGLASERLRRPRLERAIGVIYRPETERLSDYFHARLADQFNAVIHLDETHALEPLDRDPGAEPEREAPDTYPTAL